MTMPGSPRGGLSRSQVDTTIARLAGPTLAPGIYGDIQMAYPASASAGIALVTGTIYTMLLPVAQAGQAVDRVSISVVTIGTATLARLAAYAVGADLIPTTLIEDYGEVDVSTTGDKEITVARTLPAGPFVCMAVQFNGGISPHVYNGFSQSVYGWTSPSIAFKRTSVTKTQAYGVFPASFGVPGGYLATCPRISVRGA